MEIEALRSALSYDPVTGQFVWRTGHRAGREAGRINRRRGYRYIGLGGRCYMAHRLAWFYVHGRWPVADIDHINRDRTDNRLANLREATRTENLRNTGCHRDNPTGRKGVSYDRARNRWAARIFLNGRTVHLGRFATPDAAQQAYIAAAAEAHGQTT